jgi:hypothetical protein
MRVQAKCGEGPPPTVEAVFATPESQEELAGRVENEFKAFQDLAEYEELNQIHALDSPFQSVGGALLRGKPYAVTEAPTRGIHLWESSEPLRLRAAEGRATRQVLDVLEAIKEAYPQLSALV